MLSKQQLIQSYKVDGMSMQQIANANHCSLHAVDYWMRRHEIARRSRSEATYLHHNPGGDPFQIKSPNTEDEHYLKGLGVGLYWGEGTKANKYAVRLGNTDPNLILAFIEFLEKLCGVNRRDLKFGLQIFSDLDEKACIGYWQKRLNVSRNQFYQPTVTKSGRVGSYRKKSQYGVLTIHYNNKKLRDIIVGMLPR